ncbi:MAG: hypothetical protein K8R53_06795, partial [Bacteroidales bacterium]|nr:hypothetical protein [Bacteroidales bacterium]
MRSYSGFCGEDDFYYNFGNRYNKNSLSGDVYKLRIIEVSFVAASYYNFNRISDNWFFGWGTGIGYNMNWFLNSNNNNLSEVL